MPPDGHQAAHAGCVCLCAAGGPCSGVVTDHHVVLLVLLHSGHNVPGSVPPQQQVCVQHVQPLLLQSLLQRGGALQGGAAQSEAAG